MKVLVIGGGGREHAIIWKINQSSMETEVFCAPGNAGIREIAQCVPIDATDIEALLAFVEKEKIDFTVVGPEEPLKLGIVDTFEKANHKIYGPKSDAAMIESSKVFSKSFMKKYNIPTADYFVFDNYRDAISYVNTTEYPIVVKADGLAVGKGVIICNNKHEAVSALTNLMVNKQFGDSGSTVVIEEFLIGDEVTILAFCDGKSLKTMVPSQDYKKAYDNNVGPNTGGMGAKSPCGVYTKAVEKICMEKIFLPTLNGMVKEGCPFVGTLYFGLMLTDKGPKVIEYNARFGDPETQVVLPRLKSDLLEILISCANGCLDEADIKWHNTAAVSVILASKGYPGNYAKGDVITGLEKGANMENAVIFHAGTMAKDEDIVTNGGRVIAVTGIGNNLTQARKAAYKLANQINFNSKQYRLDIGM